MLLLTAERDSLPQGESPSTRERLARGLLRSRVVGEEKSPPSLLIRSPPLLVGETDEGFSWVAGEEGETPNITPMTKGYI